MVGDLHGKITIITGAAGEIGTALCEAFEEAGAVLVPTDAAEIAHPGFVAGDLSDAQFPGRLLDEVLRRHGRVDVLVNNAGICPRTPLDALTPEEWQRVLTVNLTAAFFLSQACLRVMSRRKAGAIVNVASMAARVGGLAVGAHYSASKAALICLTKSLARAGAPCGVRANAVAPGVIDSAMTRGASPEQQLAYLQSIPLGRLGGPSEVARPVVFLASSAASYITGATLDINGGLLMD